MDKETVSIWTMVAGAGAWGKGPSLKVATKNWKKHGGSGIPELVAEVDQDARVDDVGRVYATHYVELSVNGKKVDH